MPSAGARPRALAAGRVRRLLCPLPKPVLQWRPPGGLRELSRLPQSPFPPSMTIPKRPVAKAGARQELVGPGAGAWPLPASPATG